MPINDDLVLWIRSGGELEKKAIQILLQKGEPKLARVLKKWDPEVSDLKTILVDSLAWLILSIKQTEVNKLPQNKHLWDRLIHLSMGIWITSFRNQYTERYIEQVLLKKVKPFLLSKGANREELDDIIQSGYEALMRNILTGKFDGRSNLSTYFNSICKYIMLTWKANQPTTYVSELSSSEGCVDDYDYFKDHTYLEDHFSWIRNMVSLLKNNCKHILRMWSLKMSAKDIAKELELKNAAVVYVRVRNCKKQLRKIVVEKLDAYEREILLFYFEQKEKNQGSYSMAFQDVAEKFNLQDSIQASELLGICMDKLWEMIELEGKLVSPDFWEDRTLNNN